MTFDLKNIFKKKWIPYFLLFVVVSVVYGKTLNFGYVWDDSYLFLDNYNLREKNISWRSLASPVIVGTSYFRPLVLLTWAVEMKLFSFDPLWSHLINCIIFFINTCLVYYIACGIFRKYKKQGEINRVALCAVSIYVFHPCLVESVSWVSGRFDLMVTTFILASCVVLRLPWSLYRGIIFGLFSLCALFSKELGVLLPLFGFIFLLAYFPSESLISIFRRSRGYFFIFFIVAIFYFILRKLGVGAISYGGFNKEEIIAALASGVWVRALSFYMFMAILPFSDLNPQHHWVVEMESWRQHWTALLISIVIFGTFVFFFFRRKVWAILGMGFFVGIFLVLRIVHLPVGNIIGSERFLCLPLVFLTFAIVELFCIISEKFKTIGLSIVGGKLFFLGWLLLAGFSTYTYMDIWRNGILFWGWQYSKMPYHEPAKYGYLLILSGMVNEGYEEEFKRIVDKIREENDGYLPRYVQLIYANYLFEKEDAEAMLYYEGVLQYQPVHKGSKQDRLISYHIEEQMMSLLYLNYATGLIVFYGDLDEAKIYLEKSKENLMDGMMIDIIYRNLVIDFLSGNKKESLESYRKIAERIYAEDLSKINQSMAGLVNSYCLLKNENNADYCFEYTEDFLGYHINGVDSVNVRMEDN